MDEGAKLVRNITVAGAFWTGFAFLALSANAQSSIYEPQTSEVTSSAGMTLESVPSAQVSVESTGTGVYGSNEGGNANTGGVQVQNVTVQAAAEAQSASSNTTDTVTKVRVETEQAHNALLLQQMELDRLRAEQKRADAIRKFGNNLDAPEHLPCGAGPCVPVQPVQPAPVIENNNSNIIIQEKAASVSIEEVDAPSYIGKSEFGLTPIVGYRWFENTGTAEVYNNFLVGIGLGYDISNWVTLEGSFIYGEDYIGGFTHPMGGWWHEGERSSYEFSGGAKFGYNVNASFRPYLALGLGYLSQAYENTMGGTTTSNLLINTGVGADFRVSKNMSLGARGDYQFVSAMGSNDPGYAIFYGDDSDRYRLGATLTFNF
jgi:hypothetical protein